MEHKSGLFKLITFVTIAVAIGIGFGWLASRPKTVTAPPPAVTDPQPAAAALHPTKLSAKKTDPIVPKAASTFAVLPPVDPDATDWSDKVSDILADASPIPDKCKEMLKLYPTLPDDGKLEVAGHLNNLVADDDYAGMAKILTDPKIPKAVAEEILFDLFNRPDTLKLPLLLQVARTPNHPASEQAHDDLALILEEDHGTDWAKWEQTMQQYLKDNPE